MNRLAIIGTSQRRGGTQALEAWTLHVQSLSSWPEAVSEVVPLLTCNRCELVLAFDDTVSLASIRQMLSPSGFLGYAFADEAALEHLCRVASSLDALNPGEDQIMKQVREAYETSKALGWVGPVTGFAFQTALRIAKSVRHKIPMAPANASLFSLVRPEFEKLLHPEATVAVVGSGKMGSLAARNLSEKNYRLILVNRSIERARALAEECGAMAMDLHGFFSSPPQIHGLVTATPVEHLISQAFLQSQGSLKVIADLGLPRNVWPAIVPRTVELFDLDKMQDLGNVRRSQIKGQVAQAEAMIQHELEQALGEWAERKMSQSIVMLRQHYHETLRQVLGERVSPQELERIVNRMVHFPIKGLRGLAKRQGVEAATIFLEEMDL
jgi:glutamyl-tRNA reductase